MRSERGYTGVDIAISIIVITIFISIITALTYRFNSSSKELELKSEALNIALNKIEEIKGKEINEVVSEDEQEIGPKQGFYQKVYVIDASEIVEGGISNLVKKATVTVSYIFKNKEEKIELSTLATREF